jgi:hypothetical protein
MNENTFAFPHEITHLQKPLTAGMTLRDYFAAKAMQGLFASDTRDWNEEGDWYERAQTAYDMADAMMEVRK